MKSFILRLGLLLSVLFLLTCSDNQPEKTIDEVTLQLKWEHQAQFAGFYMAQEKGYYAAENLKVNFLEGGPGIDVIGKILTGEADFGVAAPEMVMVKRQKLAAPITAIAAIYRRSAIVYVAKKDTGIKGPEDLSGKTIAVLSSSGSPEKFSYQLKAMLNKLNIDTSSVHLVQYDPDYKDFINGDVEVTFAFLTGGVIRLRNNGIELNTIWPGDYGIQMYSDTLVTTEKIISQRPDVVQRFLRASLKGWRDALGNTTEAVEATLKYAKVKDSQFQSDMLDGLRPLVDTGQDQIGWMSQETWDEMHKILVAQKILAEPIEGFEKVYDTDFIHFVYGASQK